MKCTIPGPNVKIIGRAIHSLARIGDELYVEPEDDSVSFRAVNSSMSAYSCFKFFKSFFTTYKRDVTDQSQNDESVKCKVSMKSCLVVFRSLASIDKGVEKCNITVNSEDAKLIFQLHCKYGVLKTFNLPFIECEKLNVAFATEPCSNRLLAQSRLLADAASNFQTNQEEVTFTVQNDKVIIRNYVDDEPDPNKVIHTVLTLDAEEFSEYFASNETEVTFCLKELRALLAFSEANNLPVSIHFDVGGKPIIFTISCPPTYEASLVLATLECENDSENSERCEKVQVDKNSTITKDISVSISNHNTEPHSSSKDRESLNSRPSVAENSFNSNGGDKLSSRISNGLSNHKESADNGYLKIRENCDDKIVRDISSFTVDKEDCIPASPPPPPSKKRKQEKAFFLGMLDSTMKPGVLFKQSEVLAPASDDED